MNIRVLGCKTLLFKVRYHHILGSHHEQISNETVICIIVLIILDLLLFSRESDSRIAVMRVDMYQKKVWKISTLFIF